MAFVTIILNPQKHFNIIMFHFISQRFAPSVEPLVFGYGAKETLHIQSSTWPRGVCQLGHGHRGCLLQMCSRLHHSPQVQQWSQSQRGNWLLEVTTYLLSLLTISGLAVVLFEKLIIKFVHFFTIQSQGIEQTTNLEVLWCSPFYLWNYPFASILQKFCSEICTNFKVLDNTSW